MDEISLAGWSLHRRFRSEKDPLGLLDFPRVAADEFGFGAIELNSPFFTSLEDSYLDRLKPERKSPSISNGAYESFWKPRMRGTGASSTRARPTITGES